MSTSVNVKQPSASARSSTSFLSSRDHTRAEAETAAPFGLLIAVGLILFVIGAPCLFVAGAMYLPDLGQFFGP